MKSILLNGISGVKNLNVDVIKNLNVDVIKNLNAYVINNLNAYVINSLNVDVINNLNAYVINSLNALKSLDVGDKPYTRILESKHYNQATYGELETCEEICRTSMCMAGWFVQFAGEKAYKIKEKTGYNHVATILHMNKYPDAPVFNYSSTNQQKGKDYLIMMSAFENRENQQKSFTEWFIENLK